MIYAIYLNPTIDKTIYIDNFGIGETNRVQSSITQGGGKALNLAKVLHNLGTPVTICGIDTSDGSRPIYEVAEGIPCSFVTVDGEPRTNIKVVDKVSSVTTEINDKGPVVDSEHLEKVLSGLADTVSEDDFVVLTGSLPLGCPKDYYAQMIARLNCKVVVDASGEALVQAVKQKPFLIKPNLDELSQLTGEKYSFSELSKVIEDTRKVLAGGITAAIVSMGKDGAVIIDKDACFYSKPVVKKPDSTVGAGDSMLAGAMSVFFEGYDIEKALKVGTASSAATISLPGTTLAGKEDIEKMMDNVNIERIR
ncbi:MAG: 1-phosphofructokinase family hexose kinase [Clostridia bacterium]|nr:1-phosphofructokinase family hexose kinase [Clostridia bacterium]